MNCKILLMIAAISVCSVSASAQFTFGIQGSYHTPSGADNNDELGKGIQAKYFFKNIPLAIGGGVRHWVKNYEKTTVNGQDIRNMDVSSAFGAYAEWYFGSKKLRPYAGTDFAVYASNIKAEFREKSFAIDGNNWQTSFGIAPKAGLMLKTGPVAPFIQAQYHFLFDGKSDPALPESNAAGNFASFDLGILFTIGNCKCDEKKK